MKRELFLQIMGENPKAKLVTYYIGMTESIYHIITQNDTLVIVHVTSSSTTLPKLIERVTNNQAYVTAITIKDLT